MWLYIRQLFQLILSPSGGWDDISEAALTPEQIQRQGFMPWLAVTALSEFVRLAYDPTLTFFVALESAVAVAGGMFVALYISRIVFEITLNRFVDGTVNLAKGGVLSLYMVGLACLFTIVANILPATLTIVHFLPLLSLLILFKSARLIGVRADDTMGYLGLGALATIVLPIVTVALLKLVII